MFRKRLLQTDAKPGDIVGFSGNGFIGAFIAAVTYGVPFWSLSHVGIIGEHAGRQYLFESTCIDDEPCAIRNQVFAGTKAKVLDNRVKSYDGKVWHYPLVRSLYDDERKRLNEFLFDTLGTPYDQIGAFRAGGAGFSWIESWFREPDLSNIFCSEWCCAAHTEIGLFNTDYVSRWSPNSFVRAERRRGILGRPRRLK